MPASDLMLAEWGTWMSNVPSGASAHCNTLWAKKVFLMLIRCLAFFGGRCHMLFNSFFQFQILVLKVPFFYVLLYFLNSSADNMCPLSLTMFLQTQCSVHFKGPQPLYNKVLSSCKKDLRVCLWQQSFCISYSVGTNTLCTRSHQHKDAYKKPTLCQWEKQNRKALNSHCVDIVKQVLVLCVGGSAYTQAVLLVNMGPSDLPPRMFVFQAKAALMTNWLSAFVLAALCPCYGWATTAPGSS